MIKVACPSCQAPYELDERRLPPGGLKMRCPKCAASFRVGPDGSVGEEAGAAMPSTPEKKTPIAPPLPQPGAAMPSTPEKKTPIAPPLPQPGVPLPPGGGGAADEAEPDLPAVKPPPRPQPPPAAPAGTSSRGRRRPLTTPLEPEAEADLPAVAVAGGVSASTDPSGAARDAEDWGDLDLPMPKGGGSSEVDLPAPAEGGGLEDELDLPMPKGAPGPAEGMEDLGEVDLPIATHEGDFPAPARDRVDLPVGRGEQDLPRVTEGRDADGGALPGLDGLDPGAEDDDVPPLPEPRAAAAAPEVGDGLPGLEGEDPLGLEFDALPEEPAPAAHAAAPAAPWTTNGEEASSKPAPQEDGAPPRSPRARALRAAAMASGVVAVILGAGFALGLTSHGSFGMYFFERFLPAAGDPAQVRAAMAEADEAAAEDTLEGARRGLRILSQARRNAGLNRELLAHSLLAESLFEIRFGPAADSASRAAAIHARLRKRGFDAPNAGTARAAHALAQGQVDEARRHLGAAGSRGGLASLLAGELALVQGRTDDAVSAFRQSGSGARASWGLARALAAGGDLEGAESAAHNTLEASPRHAAARGLLARAAWVRDEVQDAERWAREAAGDRPVEGRPLRASARTRAAAWSLLGRVHARAGRRGHARTAYETAVQASADTPEALVGLGRLLVAGGRAQEALARLEGAVRVLREGAPLPPGSEREALAVQARLGEVRALLAQDRVADARSRVAALAEEHPEDEAVLLWRGKTEEAAGEHGAAEAHYRALMERNPEAFDGYLALAELHLAQQRPDEAGAVLERAREHVPETAQVRRLIGNAELARDRVDAAIEAFEGALALDPRDAAALFGLGVALLRAERLDRAAETFDALAERDPDYPGLAVERGRIHELRGRSEEAVTAYRAALEQRSDDPDVKLRLAAALVAVGTYDEADALLDEVLEARTRSAEAIHFKGRVALARGRLREAQVHLEQAVGRDASRAAFHLYLARAHLQRSALTPALEAVEEALERDPQLGDAYWIRGRLRLRTGAVRDAQRDLRRALELAPDRAEAHADSGESHDQLGQRREAMAAYERALELDDTRGRWWYRLARLQLHAGRRGQALASLERATALGDAADAPPGWLADAHRSYAETLQGQGRGREAIPHYERYLALAPEDAIDRRQAQAALDRLR